MKEPLSVQKTPNEKTTKLAQDSRASVSSRIRASQLCHPKKNSGGSQFGAIRRQLLMGSFSLPFSLPG
jgi:hypothetical protein